jgi:Protein of unknown function (DUF3592)
MTQPPGSPFSLVSKLIMTAFAVVWIGLTVSFDVMIFRAASLQLQTYHYLETTGTILESEVVTRKDDEGDQHRLKIRYRYLVDGVPYESHRYSFHTLSTSDSTWHTIQAENPVGGVVPVYADPDDPATAVLARGLLGFDLFMVMFMIPFNLIGFGGLGAIVFGHRWEFSPENRRIIVRRDSGWEYRPAGHLGIPVFFGTIGMGAFLGIFLIGFTLGFNPPLPVMATVMVLGFLGSLRYTLWKVRQWTVRSDVTTETWTLRNKQETIEVPTADIQGIVVRERVTKDSDGDPQTTFVVVLEYLHPDDDIEERRSFDLHVHSNLGHARRMADWFAEQLPPAQGRSVASSPVCND